MLFLEILILAYMLLAVLATSMVFSAIDSKTFRLVFIVAGLTMPFILVYAAIRSLFTRSRMPRFNEEMANVEDEIETERLRIFGGERMCPSFGDHWRRAYEQYLETLVENAASAQERLARIGFDIRHIHIRKVA